MWYLVNLKAEIPITIIWVRSVCANMNVGGCGCELFPSFTYILVVFIVTYYCTFDAVAYFTGTNSSPLVGVFIFAYSRPISLQTFCVYRIRFYRILCIRLDSYTVWPSRHFFFQKRSRKDNIWPQFRPRPWLSRRVHTQSSAVDRCESTPVGYVWTWTHLWMECQMH